MTEKDATIFPVGDKLKNRLRLLAQALILLTVMLVAALVTMRLAIHGREVAVPKVVGMSLRQAEEVAGAHGLPVDVENRFYSAEIPEGRIVSQLPPPGTQVRRGWRLRVAQSLGPQRAVIPDLVGESGRAAEMNARRRGLEVGATVTAHIPGLPPGQVVAQSPPPNAVGVATPKINLLVTAGPDEQSYIMPDFVGHRLAEASAAIEQAGLRLGDVTDLAAPAGPSVILKQSPPPGQRVTPGTVVTFEVAR
jgi:beta-lactam-binding protein with PASTA domain